MNQFNPQSGFVLNSELRETSPKQLHERVHIMANSYAAMISAVQHLHPRVVNGEQMSRSQSEAADEVASRDHTFYPARSTELSVVKPTAADATPKEYSAEAQKRIDESLAAVRQAHDQSTGVEDYAAAA